MAPLYKIILVLGAVLASSVAFAAFDVYVPGGAIYKADIVNNQLLLIGRDGKKNPAPDGLYMTAEGKKYKVAQGILTAVVAKPKETTAVEQTKKEPEANTKKAVESKATTNTNKANNTGEVKKPNIKQNDASQSKSLASNVKQ